jgi:hypothetical protein
VKARTRTLLLLGVAFAVGVALAAYGQTSTESRIESGHGLSIGEVIATVLAALLAVAFAAWAKRLDKALDLLEKIQVQMHRQSIRTERRLTRLEQIAVACGNGHHLGETDDDDEG